ncbi:MAG: hypothetical protein ABIG89_02655 [Candidatus Woesearchaeota archaeon]
MAKNDGLEGYYNIVNTTIALDYLLDNKYSNDARIFESDKEDFYAIGLEHVKIGRKTLAELLGIETDRLTDLTPEAETIHQEAHQLVESFLGRSFAQREVYAISGLNIVGASFPILPVILIDSDITGLKPDYSDYLVFAVDNKEITGKLLKPNDYLMSILCHEYGHQVFSECYKQEIEHLISRYLPSLNSLSDSNQDEPELRARLSIDEAFAFWFGEEVYGVSHLSEALANIYEKRLDSRLMKHIYSVLKTKSKQHGKQYVLDNFVDIVSDNIDNILPVRLRATCLAVLLNDDSSIYTGQIK